jgi:cell wall-associated NlpC family hydrolase
LSTSRTSLLRSARLRRGLVALTVGAGVALTPLPAFAATGPAHTALPVHAAVAPTNAAQVAVNTALAQLGKPYRWGATGPGSYDCSGLALAAYRAAGVSLPRSSRAQSTVGRPVPLNALQPGDLLFFYQPVSHVAIYIGNGKMVHASTYGQPVKVTDLKYMPGLVSARRLG